MANDSGTVHAADDALQADGKILVVGSARSSSSGLAMGRIAPRGVVTRPALPGGHMDGIDM